jgi:hypothetical protein
MGKRKRHIEHRWESQKRPVGRPRIRWVDNTKLDFREITRDGMDWIDLAEDRNQRRSLVNTAMNLRVP